MKVIDENSEVVEDDFFERKDANSATTTTTSPVVDGVAAMLPSATRSRTQLEQDSEQGVVWGVLYGRSVRSGYACLHLYCPPPSPADNNGCRDLYEEERDADAHADEDDDDKSLSDGDTLLIRLQFMVMNDDNDDEETLKQPVQLRSHIRRFCKPGDLLSIRYNAPSSCQSSRCWRQVGNHIDTDWQDLRLVINLESVQHADQVLQVRERRYWTIVQVQACQRQFCGRAVKSSNRHEEDPTRLVSVLAPPSAAAATTTVSTKNKSQNPGKSTSQNPHGGLLKRTQGEYLRNFLAHMILLKLSGGNEPDNVKLDAAAVAWATTAVSQLEMNRVRDYLNQGSGVLDVAGGSGHVSMALGLEGIQSTIVDPRDKVGNLPGRDRKIWNRAWKRVRAKDFDTTGDGNENDSEQYYCQPVQYNVYRAWFGSPPEVRYEDQTDLPVCGGKDESDANNNLLTNCRAIAALHPDEATDAIVDTAVRRRIPFVIVPCCVFYRLFPNRKMPSDPSQPVSTYEDLLDYLQAKDPSIQRTLLPFEGANTLLWSIF